MHKATTTTVGVYCTQYGVQPDKVHSLPADKLGDLQFHKVSKHLPEGWVQVGTAEVTVTLFDRDTTLKTQVEALQAMKKNLQAETQVKLNQIEGKIQSLLALENT